MIPYSAVLVDGGLLPLDVHGPSFLLHAAVICNGYHRLAPIACR